MVLALLVLLTAAAAVLRADAGVDGARGVDRAHSVDRVLHRFDFDELSHGNLESIPKYWEPLRPRGFPHFSHGEFDFTVGTPAPPSFHLISEGRNVAYHYSGPDTPVRTDMAYRVVGFIRGDGLRHARACLSAHYLDAGQRPIADTFVRSRYIGGTGDSTGWEEVGLHMSPAPVEARSIGVAAWVLQGVEWAGQPEAPWRISRTDVRGGAWFDDITIYALPRVELTSSAAGHVLTSAGTDALRVLLSDDDARVTIGRLTVRDAEGQCVITRQLHTATGAAAWTTIPVGHLPPGLYQAELEVLADGTRIDSRTLSFACLAALPHRGGGASDSFGIALDPETPRDPLTETALLDHLAVGSVKVPVWPGLTGDASADNEEGAQRLLHSLVERGMALTGVFYAPPGRAVQGSDGQTAALIDLLTSDLAAWRSELARSVAPYAGAFRWWQIGGDGLPVTARAAGAKPQVRLGEPLAHAVHHLYEAMRPLIALPRIAVPLAPGESHGGLVAAGGAAQIGGGAVVRQMCTEVGPGVQPDWLQRHIGALKESGYDRVTAYVAPLPAESYRRIDRLGEWTRRLLAARHAGADTVYVPQPWRTHHSDHGPTIEPDETFVLLRTLAAILGDAEAGPRLPITGSVTALAFYDGDSAIVALWDAYAPPDGREHALQLGRADRLINLWGRETRLPRNESGRHVVRLGPIPVLIPGVERWLVDLQTSFALAPSHFESGSEAVQQELTIRYRGVKPLSGTLVWQVPQPWHVSPRSFEVNLAPGLTSRHKVALRLPHNEPAGTRAITANVELSDPPYRLEIPLAIEIGVTDLSVSGSAAVENGDLVLRHAITNRSATALSFRGSATVPGRERQHRPIPVLRPGESQTVEYRFPRAGTMIGRRARLSLREANDGRRHHTLEVSVP